MILTKTTEIISAVTALDAELQEHRRIANALIKGIVKLRQEYRLEKNYFMADQLREILSSVGIEIIQGTAGYEYEDIPKSLKGRQFDDTWEVLR